ncbi:hypothetical protein HOY82DRAFT_670091 [Tuber indicum]|nr:hypothetical protein HOY82DRAFT_670091 [Tuber indicum]
MATNLYMSMILSRSIFTQSIIKSSRQSILYLRQPGRFVQYTPPPNTSPQRFFETDSYVGSENTPDDNGKAGPEITPDDNGKAGPEISPDDSGKAGPKLTSQEEGEWHHVLKNERRLDELSKSLKFHDSEVTRHKAMSDIAVTLETRFTSVQTQFASMQTQLTLLGGELRSFADAGKNQLGVYGIKQLMQFYIPQIAPKISPPTTTETVEKSAREAEKGDVGGKDAGREG